MKWWQTRKIIIIDWHGLLSTENETRAVLSDSFHPVMKSFSQSAWFLFHSQGGHWMLFSTHVITVTCSDLCKSLDRNWSQHPLDPGVGVHHHYYQNTSWRKVSLKYTFKYLENQCRGAWRSNSLIRCFMLFFFFNFHFIAYLKHQIYYWYSLDSFWGWCGG